MMNGFNASIWFMLALVLTLIGEYFMPLHYNYELSKLIGLLFLLLALIVTLIAKRSYQKHATSYHPKEAPKVLIKDGIYAYSRHPIYIALILSFIGISLVLMLSLLPLGLLILFCGINYDVIAKEETRLIASFGDSYKNYQHYVPKWL